MKFIINSKDLNKALTKIQPAIKERTVLPILENVHVEVRQRNCTITGTNMNLTISVDVECASKETFKMLLPFNSVYGISKLFSNEPMTIENGEQISLMAMNEKYKLGKREDHSVYPQIPTVRSEISFEAGGEIIDYMQMAKECVDDRNVPIYTDVTLELKNGTLSMYATNANILFIYNKQVDCKVDKIVNVDASFAKAISTMPFCTISADGEKVKAQNENMVVYATQGEQKFPISQSLAILGDSSCNYKTNRQELITLLDRIMVFKSAIYDVSFNFNGSKTTLTFDDNDLEQHFVADIQSAHSVELERINLNAKFLKKLLSFEKEEDVNMFFKSPNSAMKIVNEESGLSLILMPLFQPNN